MAEMSDDLRGVVGGATAKRLAEAFDIHTIGDLVHHYPRRYQPHKDLTDFATLARGDHVTVIAEVARAVENTFTIRNGPRRGKQAARTDVSITDGHHRLDLVFFLGPKRQGWRAASFPVGARGVFTGTISMFRDRPQLAHPRVRMLTGDSADVAPPTRDLLAIYPASNAIDSLTIAQAVDLALVALNPVPEPLDAALRGERRLVALDRAIRLIHQPDSLEQVDEARGRLAYDEALETQVELALRRRRTEAFGSTARPKRDAGILAEFDERAGVRLTAGQQAVGAEISADLARSRPMHRLLQGDVGSGKTMVALRAMLQVVDTGGQSVLLAPTEVLAQQHHASLGDLLGELGQGGMLGAAEHATSIALLTGSLNATARRAVLLRIANGEAGLVVGTHALLQESVEYADLGLIVVDEQHRFGVEQRSALLDRIPGTRPHLLVMTATPIPRTVAMTVFGDLETSTLLGRPGGPSRVVTHVVSESAQPAHLDRAWERVREEVRDGHPVFVVCTRIDDAGDDGDGDGTADEYRSDPEEATPLAEHDQGPPIVPHAALTLADTLTNGPLTGLRVGVLHGRMPADQKAAAMAGMAAAPDASDRLDVLVSTTVIEVGVDVPAATMMVIMDAERFGVSQLHQLRGRVGRAGQPGLCLLVTQTSPGSPSHRRLQAVAASNDGFELALLDLEQRREGDVLGAAQSGHRSSLRLLSVLRDEALIETARSDAARILAHDPELADHPVLAASIARLERSRHSEFLEKA